MMVRWFPFLSPWLPPLGYTISSLSNGYPGCPGEGPRFSAPRRPSTSSLLHPSLGEESTHTLIGSDEQVRIWWATLKVGRGPRKGCGKGKKLSRAPSYPQKGGSMLGGLEAAEETGSFPVFSGSVPLPSPSS